MPVPKTSRFYIDEDASDADLLAALRQAGLDVLSASEANNLRLSDEDQLAFATALDRSLYSFNARDYVRIHTEWINAGRTHAGIVLAAQGRLGIGAQMQALTRVRQPLRNQIVFLSAKSTML